MKPVRILIKVQKIGSWLIICNNAADDAIADQAPNVLICPTFETIFGTNRAPRNNPRKYPPISNPIEMVPNSALFALNPMITPSKPFPTIIKNSPQNNAQDVNKFLSKKITLIFNLQFIKIINYLNLF